jgi:hypothetical protein
MLDSDMSAIAPLPDYSEDGVDLTLIRWILSLTPAERLAFLEERINEILAIRDWNVDRHRGTARGEKGLAVLPILRRTLSETQKKESL